MKKNFKFKIVSLALCAISCLVLAMVTFTKTVKNADAENVTEINNMYTIEDFTINETASVRRVEPVGIRFTTVVDATVKANIINQLGGDANKVVFGTLILPTDMLGGQELTHHTPSVVVAIPDSWNSDTVYTAVLGGEEGGANLSDSYYNRPISARSFALNIETGNVCYTTNTANRSIGYVAVKAKEDGDKSDVVAGIAEKTKTELVFNENVSIHNEESEGSALVENKYAQSSKDAFVLKIGGIIEDVDITYTSSNNSAITISNGEVTAVGNGVSTVTGTVTYNGVKYSVEKELSTDHHVADSKFTILLPADASEEETTAANKLQDVILEATGVELKIATETGTETTDGKYLSVGDTVLAEANCAISDLTKDTASRVKTVGNTIFVRGKTERGTLIGAQQLLKDVAGYVYYLDNTYVVEKRKEIVIEDKDYVPQIDEVRQLGGTADINLAGEQGAAGYSSYLVPIGTTDTEDAEGTYRYKGAAHNSILFFNDGVNDSSLYSLSSKSFKKWYATNSSSYYLTNTSGLASLTSGAGKVELCYTAHGDSSVRSAMIEKLAAEMFRKMTTIEEFKSYNRVAFSHADHQSWCECSYCKNEGNPSDNMLHFILDVAANLKTKLTNAGDARANTFKICTLFYNETNLYAKNIANYQSAVDDYMQHVEIWFAETRADYHVSLDAATTWNTTAKSNFDNWTALASSEGGDVLWWGYYANTKSMFIPYDSIDALRANYALAYNAGVDYMFNQGLQYKANWMRLKQYLMSELTWNATPDDATWNGWIADYMKGAFDQGATAMTEYYNAWQTWADTNADLFKNTDSYGDSGISKLLSEVANSTNMSFATLKGWLDSCNKALAALDVNDKNYQTYYNNIVLERLTPLYLIMHLYGFNYSISTSNNPYEAITSYTLKNSAYVLPYAQDFLDGIELWGIYQDGEMSTIDTFKETLQSQVSGVEASEETAKQTVVSSTSITLNSANIVAGESYTATLVTSAGEVTATSVTANDGSVALTFDSDPAVGSANVVLRSSSKAITFTNVLLVTGTISNYTQLKAITGKTVSGYYVLTNDITDATGTITLRAGSFSGVLDGNGYSVDGVSVGASGLFRALSDATIKNINFTNFSATAPAFGTSATNSTFENVTVSFKQGGPNLVTTDTNCTYKNVLIYVTSASAIAMPDGVRVIVGEETGKTFYISEGETEVWLRDSRLVKGNYAVDVNGDVTNVSVFTEGRMKVAIKGLALGETIKVSCNDGEKAYVYNVMRVAKLVAQDKTTLIPVYNGDKLALGFNSADVVQVQSVTHTAGWDSAIETDQVVIKAPGTQDYITIDFVITTGVSGSLFQLWPQKGTGSISGTLATFSDSPNDPSGVTADVIDEYGFKANTIVAGKKYTLRVYDKNATKLGIGIYGTNTVYFGNVTYGTGELPTPNTPPNVTVGDSRVYSIYQGDETALGYAEGTMVFNLVNATPDSLYDDGWGKRMIFGASTTQDYITFEFVAKENVEASNVFHVWGANGAPSIGTVSASTGKGGDWAIILDEYGFGVASIKAGKHYFASVACAGLTEVQVGLLDANELYVANVTEHNGALPTAKQPLVYAGDNSALSVYEGDETALGFEEGTLVFESLAGASTWNDNAIKFVTDSANNCVEIDFALNTALAPNCNQFMIWTSKVSSGAAAFINNANVTQNAIDVEIFDAEGNAPSSFEANKKYTLKIYHAGSTDVTIALVGDTQAGVTIYYAHDYRQNNDVLIGLPEIVVTNASGANLPQYTGDATTYGFGAEDYVFEATMTDVWNDRVIIPVDSTNYDYMDVEFVVTSGAWYFNAWVVAAGGMLDGNYSVAENTSNATYGSGFAPHTPNTGANGGNTRIQVLDTNGNVLTGARSVGTRYILRVYTCDESLTQVQIGQNNTTILLANVTYGIEETITGVTNTSCVTVYDGDETTLGFADGSRVYTYVGTDASKDKAAFKVDSTYDYVEVQFVIGSGDGYFFGYVLNGGNYLNSGSSYVIDPSNLRLGSGAEMDRVIQVFNANGNLVSTLMSTNTLYTLRVYTDGIDEFRLAKAGSTIYLANVTFGNDVAVQKPTEVVVWGEGKEELPQYAGNNADIGFADSDYVFEQECTTESWSSRAHIGNNSTADFLVFDFSTSNPQNLTVWFTRNGNVIGGYSNIVTATTYVAANECPARTIYVFDASGNAVTQMEANTKYQMWVYLGGAESFHGVAIGNGNSITVYYANVRYVYGTGDNIFRQKEANDLLSVYTGDVTEIGFEAGTFVQMLTGTSDSWTEDVYANRARLTASGTQDYISFDFAVQSELSGANLFYLWSSNANDSVAKDGTSGTFTTQLVDEYGFAVTSIEAGKRYTFIVYDPGATYLAIGAYCNNVIYFANVTYGTGEPEEPYSYLGGLSGTLPTYDGDVTTLGFAEGEYVQQWAWTPSQAWDSTAEGNGVTIYGQENSYTSIMFSLAEDFTSTDSLFFAWTHAANGDYVSSAYFYVYLTANDNARILATNGDVLTDTLKANTVYMLEVYFPAGVTYCNLGNVSANALTVSFATKSIKTYSTSIASSPVTGSRDGAVTVHQGTEPLGFGRNEVVKRLETETVSSVWGDTQPTSGVGRASWLIKVASEAGKKVTIRFALSQDFTSTGMLFYVWAYSDNSGTCPANGSVTLSGSNDMTASITDEAGNAVSELKAYQVYELTLYVETAIKYDIGNFVAEGMITYVSSTVTLTDANA